MLKAVSRNKKGGEGGSGFNGIIVSYSGKEIDTTGGGGGGRTKNLIVDCCFKGCI